MFYNGNYWSMGLPMLFIFLCLFILIYLFIKVVPSSKENKKETPLDILKKRLAKGEITNSEFDTMKKKLESI